MARHDCTWPLGCAAAFLVYSLARIYGAAAHAGIYLEDDAYFYIVIARNIVETGASSFDGQTLTNGYHPLWLIVLTLQHAFLGPSPLVTLLIEAALLSAALYLFLTAIPAARGLVAVLFLLAFVFATRHTTLGGMEISLFVFCLAFLFNLSARACEAHGQGAWIGLAAAACIGARLDAAAFILPTLAFLPIAARRRIAAFMVIGVLGALYALSNALAFGAALPISGTVKSLGGLQLNALVITQVKEAWSDRGLLSIYVQLTLLLLLAPILIVCAKPGTFARALALGATIGGALYVVELGFASSWRIWPWYGYAMIFPIITTYALAAQPVRSLITRAIASRLPAGPGRFADTVMAAAGVALLGLLAIADAHRPSLRQGGFAAINSLALARYGDILAGARVAMGDRAGSFAWEYQGPVTQLEGLVNDTSFLRALRRGGDITSLLCARGVKFLVDYERELGAYREHHVSVLRPWLTQFSGPTIHVSARDEVGRVRDLAVYDNTEWGGEGDTTLYIWRLSACRSPREAKVHRPGAASMAARGDALD